MFENLRQAFREAVENFHAELNRDAIPEATDRLLAAMSREVVDAHRRLDEVRKEVARVRGEAEREEEAARTCLRREEMARGIGDRETEEVARNFAVRHLRRKDLLTEKASVLDREIQDRAGELEEMMTQLKGARARREAMSASAGRTQARERIQEADDLFAQMERMEERIRDMEGRAEAAEAFGAMELEGEDPAAAKGDGSAPGTASPDVEARLQELKRRMGRE